VVRYAVIAWHFDDSIRELPSGLPSAAFSSNAAGCNLYSNIQPDQDERARRCNKVPVRTYAKADQ
jgi:hypothetical protein